MLPELSALFNQLNQVLLGKNEAVKTAVACILAQGHLLLEDVPGVGKTTLAHGLALSLGLNYRRVQFTNDMLPADLLGVTVFHPAESKFVFRPGPVFRQFVLADEINRASPKVQSALLEAMEERQVSIDGKTYTLPMPFMVIATQNPTEQIGTFPLPESQLDRFLMRITLGYPADKSEKYLYVHGDRRNVLANLRPVADAQTVLRWQKEAAALPVSAALADYVYRLVAATRVEGVFMQGLSPRAGLGLIRAAKAWAFVHGQNVVLPEDVQAVFVPVTAHRLKTFRQGSGSVEAVRAILEKTAVG